VVIGCADPGSNSVVVTKNAKKEPK
jgi:hypothetical protein